MFSSWKILETVASLKQFLVTFVTKKILFSRSFRHFVYCELELNKSEANFFVNELLFQVSINN